MTSMQHRKLQLWLAAMRPHLVRLLQSSRLAGYFKTTSSVNDALYRISKADRTLSHASPVQNLRRKAASPVQVRIEVMQNICQRMAASGQALPIDFGAGFGPASRYGF